jgi:hypothetical protein
MRIRHALLAVAATLIAGSAIVAPAMAQEFRPGWEHGYGYGYGYHGPYYGGDDWRRDEWRRAEWRRHEYWREHEHEHWGYGYRPW